MTDKQTIEELKKDNKKIIVYGNANHAKIVREYLKKNGLEPESFVVDDRYYYDGAQFCDKPIKRISEIKNHIDDYNIVLGFCNVEKTKMIINNRDLLKGEFFLLWEPYEAYRWDEKYIEVNRDKLIKIRDSLCDKRSKLTLDALIKAKLSCDPYQMLSLADDNQYFNELTFHHDTSNEVYVDCGAFNGDTITKYCEFANNKYKKIYAFEPNDVNLIELRNNVAPLHDVTIINKGTWFEDSILYFNMDGSASQISDTGETNIQVTSIDKVIDEKVTFIKMDVEGSELESLKGAEKTITRDMPKLAICCYHKTDDLISLFEYISSFKNKGIEYAFYLRHHSNAVYETVLYAIPLRK